MLLGFKKQFALPIQLGTKVFTLRKRRKVQPKIGEKLYMYSGLRTKHTELISNKETLRGIQSVRLAIYKHGTRTSPTYFVVIKVDGRKLFTSEMHQFTKFDGFKSLKEWAEYWLAGETRVGAIMQMFHWTDLKY